MRIILSIFGVIIGIYLWGHWSFWLAAGIYLIVYVWVDKKENGE